MSEINFVISQICKILINIIKSVDLKNEERKEAAAYTKTNLAVYMSVHNEIFIKMRRSHYIIT
jgi:hypothetical protein